MARRYLNFLNGEFSGEQDRFLLSRRLQRIYHGRMGRHLTPLNTMAIVQPPKSPEPIDDFAGWLAAFLQTTVLIELATLGACMLLAWSLVRGVRRTLGMTDARSIWLGKRDVDGVLFPLILLCLAFLARLLLAHFMSVTLFKLAIPVLVALLAIRVGVKVLQAAFSEAKWVKPLEQTISWLAWLLMVLWVSGLLPVMLNELDQITWKMGNSTMSARNVLEGALMAGVVLIVTLWMSAGIESRLLRNATGSELSLRMAISNAVRAVLIFVGVIVALSAVGIDLTALSVLGGAVGVGIGLGLQKLAANYVSGFVILAERSVRIGDSVRVDTFEGVITQINARYTVIRSKTGRDSIVPNEMMIISRVENLSMFDKRLAQSTTVTVGFDSDVERVSALLLQAAVDQPLVLLDPAPLVNLAHFASYGLEFTVDYFVADSDVAVAAVKSAINMAILRSLRAHGISIPYPQQVLHQPKAG
jgi:small-conductance mechanosensitive channel